MQTMTEVHLIDTQNEDTTVSLVWPRQNGLEYFVEHNDNHLYILASFGDGWQVGFIFHIGQMYTTSFPPDSDLIASW